MAMVFAASGLDGSEKLLLLAYTNYTDPHGYCWPGEERLAEDTGTSVSTVRRTKKKLVGKNLVKSVRRPETSNLARVNLSLLASMGRPRKVYDDNEVERLSFGSPSERSPEDGSDQGTVQSDLSLQQGSDLLTVQSDLDHRSDCAEVQVRLNCGPGQSDLQSLSDPPGDAISRPSVPGDVGEQRDGGMDGSEASGKKEEKLPAAASRVPSTPGVELLTAIGADQPEFLLTGKTLLDQGLMVTAMLGEGWTAVQLRQVIAGRPLPDPVRTSVGAVVSGRLSAAAAGPVPRSVPRLPNQPARGYRGLDDTPTPIPASWETQQGVHALDHRPGECNGLDGTCGRPTEAGYDKCVSCLGWEPCGECGTRRAPRGEVCRDCAAEQAYAGT